MAEQQPVPAADAPSADQMIVPTSDFMRRVEAESGVKVSACYGCKKCSNGCPVTFAMDFHPYQVVRYVQLGLPERLEGSRTIWVCASCQTCLTRCPNEVDLPRLMDYLKETVVKRNLPVEEKRTKLFHRLFLREVKARGRVFEGSLMTRYLLQTGGAFGPEAFKNAKLGLAMFKRGRMKLLPAGTKDRRWLKGVFAGLGRK
jgi:heterodisulfide reductase subunit C